jgi:phosphatidylglycerophosphatase A
MSASEAPISSPPGRLQPKHRIAEVIATWFGCGLAPKAPGTVGALAAWPVHWGLQLLPEAVQWLALVLLAALGTWASQVVASRGPDKDPGRVVVDEVLGALLALRLGAPHGGWAEVFSMAMFRVLDITKPGPIARAERVSPPGVGIMLDDVVAGIGAGTIVQLGSMLLANWLHL